MQRRRSAAAPNASPWRGPHRLDSVASASISAACRSPTARRAPRAGALCTEDGHRVLTAARFEHAVFAEDVDFRRCAFVERVSFANARFDGEADFRVLLRKRASTRHLRARGDLQRRHVRARDLPRRGAPGVVEMTHVTFDAGADFHRVLFGDTLRVSVLVHGQPELRRGALPGLTDLTARTTDAMAEISFDDVLCEGQIDAAARRAARHGPALALGSRWAGSSSRAGRSTIEGPAGASDPDRRAAARTR